jgi:hypothetical protein
MSNLGEVISLCDLTGHMVEDWAEAGYRCWCVDFQHSIRKMRTKGNVNFVWGDARSWIPPFNLRQCVFVGCFPTCTDMAVTGARDFKIKGLPLLMDGFDLFNYCVQKAAWSGAPYGVENPVGVLSTHHRQPDYIFNPCDYGGYLNPPGDAYTKKTCLWTGNGFVMPEPKPVEPVEGSKMHGLPPSKDRKNLRSETPRGFARAVFLANAPHLIGGLK